MSITITELVQQAHANAVAHGWWQSDRSPLEMHMLIVTEIAEATEAVRMGLYPMADIDSKPEGELVELADAVIRIADYCGRRGFDLEAAIEQKMAYNAKRPHRHGGKLY